VRVNSNVESIESIQPNIRIKNTRTISIMKNKSLLVSALICAGALWSQDPDQDPNQTPAPDPPSRVARLNLIEGQVSFQPATITDWTVATLNYPVTIGDHLYADDNSRAELHIGTTAVRLGPKSGLSFLNLDDHLVQIRLDQGALIVRVKNLADDDSYEIDTAQGAITLLRPGEYRIDSDPDRNATMVTVRTGDAAVTSNGGSFPVHAHQTGYYPGDGTQPQLQTENPNDAFDQFATDLDHQDDQMPAPRYVSQDMPGWQDLDRNGRWTQDPNYGPVWRPQTVDAGWAPYRYGHWAWIEPWGWTWIDDAPWGFAPFHYGRWVMVGGTWAWVPGPVVRRPVYAPALVAFVGGNGFHVAVGGGGVAAVAWFPLGPREVYRPAYAVSPVYINRVNVVNVTNVTVVNRVYVNQTVGVTAVDNRTFVSAQPVHRAIIPVPREAIARAEVVNTAAVAPQRASVMGRAGASANVPHPPAQVMERQVYAHHTPPPPPVAFAARQQALQANPGHPVAPQTLSQLRTTALVRQPAVRTVSPSLAAVHATPATPSPARPVTPPVERPAATQPRPADSPVTPAESRPAAHTAAPAEPRPAAREEKPAAKKENKKKKAEEKKEEK
jgi:hypothetical protein